MLDRAGGSTGAPDTLSGVEVLLSHRKRLWQDAEWSPHLHHIKASKSSVVDVPPQGGHRWPAVLLILRQRSQLRA